MQVLKYHYWLEWPVSLLQLLFFMLNPFRNLPMRNSKMIYSQITLPFLPNP